MQAQRQVVFGVVLFVAVCCSLHFCCVFNGALTLLVIKWGCDLFSSCFVVFFFRVCWWFHDVFCCRAFFAVNDCGIVLSIFCCLFLHFFCLLLSFATLIWYGVLLFGFVLLFVCLLFVYYFLFVTFLLSFVCFLLACSCSVFLLVCFFFLCAFVLLLLVYLFLFFAFFHLFLSQDDDNNDKEYLQIPPQAHGHTRAQDKQ